MDQHGRTASARFPLGRVVATQGVLAALEEAGQTLWNSLLVTRLGTGENWMTTTDTKTNSQWLVAFTCFRPTPFHRAPGYGSSPKPIVL